MTMKTNYDEEATLYQGSDNEATQFEGTSNDEVEVKAAKKDGWKRVAAGAGSGLLIGSVSTVLMGMTSTESDPSEEKPESDNNHKEELSNPEWVDDQIQVSTSVNDDMSFGEAFAAARAEVGPGGCFEWHGNLYGTYTADEWNDMTAEQRAEWSDHFSWNHIDHSSGNVAQHSTTAHADHTAQAHITSTDDEDIEVVSVNHENDANDVAHHETVTTGSEEVQEVALVSGTESEIEILGVVQDNETGANIGAMSVDGQGVIVVDVDGDMGFDYMASDLNGNGQVEQNEVVDIQGQGLTVNDLGGFTDTTGNMLASNNASECTTDSYEG